MPEGLEHIETKVVHRTVTVRDLPFITSTWLKSGHRRAYRHVDRRVYFHWHHRVLEAIIPTSNVIIACDEKNPDRIYGYGVARSEPPLLVVHYLYTREGWRGQGIAESIVRAWLARYQPTQIAWTHSTEAGDELIAKHRDELPAAVYNPYLAFLEWSVNERKRA